MIRSLPPEEKAGPNASNKKANVVLENSTFAPSLKSIISCLKGRTQSAEYIKESSETPQKIIELQQILKLIIEATYKPPNTKDSEEVKQQKVKELNFNSLLMAVMGEAVKVATAMTQRRSVAVAGPFSLTKAHSLT